MYLADIPQLDGPELPKDKNVPCTATSALMHSRKHQGAVSCGAQNLRLPLRKPRMQRRTSFCCAQPSC